MAEKDIKILMRKYLNGTITKREESLLEEFDSRLLLKNDSELVNSENERNKVRSRIYYKINNSRKTPYFTNLITVAASIAILFGIGYLFYKIFPNESTQKTPIEEVVITTEWGQKMNLSLSDGTQVHLNSGTTIRFPKKFSKNKRLIELEGEAFFEVAKDPDKPFIIKSAEVNTTVYGTSFNVNNYADKDKIAVTVATGKVKVDSNENEVFLGPNDQGVFNKTTQNISKKKVKLADFLNWKEGIIHFEDVPLIEVTKTLGRWYGVTFVFENKKTKQCHLTATYDNEILTLVLESMAYAKKGLQFEYLEDKRILIKGKCTD